MAPNGIALPVTGHAIRKMETDMKTAIAVIVSGCAILGAAPAFADGISLAKGVKLCKTQMEQVKPALQRFTVDLNDSSATETHLAIQFNARDAEGRLDKFICTVDRVARTAAVAPKPRRSGAFDGGEYAGQQRVAKND
jgi:hypothetical protein